MARSKVERQFTFNGHNRKSNGVFIFVCQQFTDAPFEKFEIRLFSIFPVSTVCTKVVVSGGRKTDT